MSAIAKKETETGERERESLFGAAPRNWHRNGELLHPGSPDKDLDQKAAAKIAKYRELYRDHRRQLDFLPAIASNKHNNRQHFWADSLLSHA